MDALFGGEVIEVSASSTSYGAADLHEDSANDTAEAVLTAVLSNTSIPDHLLANNLYNDAGLDFEKYYQYAKANFPEALSQISKVLEISTLTNQAFIQTIQDVYGVPTVSVDYFTTDDIKISEYLAQEELQYNPYTMVIPSTDSRIHTITNLYFYAEQYKKNGGETHARHYVNYTVLVTDPSDLAYTNTSTTVLKLRDIRVYAAKPRAGISATNMGETLYEDDTYAKVYFLNGNYWIAKLGDPRYPDITTNTVVRESENDFYPVVTIKRGSKYIRKEVTPADDDNPAVYAYDLGEEFYTSTNNMLSMMNMNVNSMAEQIRKTSKSQPDDAKINAAYLYLGVNVTSPTIEAARYYYDFFNDLFEDSRYVIGTEYIEFQDITGKGLDMRIGHSGVTKDRVVDTQYTAKYVKIIDGLRLKLMSKVSGTANTYDRVIVANPKHRTDVYKEYGVRTNLTTAVNGNRYEGVFRLPLSRDIYKNYGGTYKNNLAKEALCLYTAAYIKVEYEWYEDPDFWKFVAAVVFIVVLIFTWYDGGYTSGTIGGFIAEIGINLALGYAISAGALYLSDAIGGDLGKVVAVIAAIYAMYLLGSFDNADTVFGDALLATTNVVISVETASIASESEQLNREMTQHNKALEEAYEHNREILDSIATLDTGFAKLISEVSMLPHESPIDFFNRTINLNPNELTYQSISNFADYQLDLPKTMVIDQAYYEDFKDIVQD